MNVFLLDPNPVVSARYLVNKHVNKMITESAQILATIFTEEELSHGYCPKTKKGENRKHAYYNHPACRWARQSPHFAKWIILNALAMEAERQLRWPGSNIHFSTSFILWAHTMIPALDAGRFWKDRPSWVVLAAMPDEFVVHGASSETLVIPSYRNYYTNGKKSIHRWTGRRQPAWMREADARFGCGENANIVAISDGLYEMVRSFIEFVVRQKTKGKADVSSEVLYFDLDVSGCSTNLGFYPLLEREQPAA